ncbi:MAG: PDDEXK nuclease domain-containing protein, partial [Leptospira sp.]|nr:PDDEXK nuclease domain-containing protein [Leptospira sp.]
MNFNLLVDSISKTHNHFQQQAAKAVNVSLTLRNWLIGFHIVEFELNGEDRSTYGQRLFEELAKRLKSINGVDRRALYRFRDFYLLYPQISIYIVDNHRTLSMSDLHSYQIMGSATPQIEELQKVGLATPQSQSKTQVPVEKLISSLSYTHFEQLLQIKDELKRTFYEIACIKGTWSVKELKRQINSLYFERSGLSTKPEILSQITKQKSEKAKASDIVKSVYAFEFLGLKVKDAMEESDLETALLDHLQDFMMEMGHGFCLEARQKKVLIGEDYFFIDLVFYHRILKCHVLVELKVEDFNHYNIGQLNTYVNYYKANVMQADDNPTVGILLVTNKNTALVEYA